MDNGNKFFAFKLFVINEYYYQDDYKKSDR